MCWQFGVDLVRIECSLLVLVFVAGVPPHPGGLRGIMGLAQFYPQSIEAQVVIGKVLILHVLLSTVGG